MKFSLFLIIPSVLLLSSCFRDHKGTTFESAVSVNTALPLKKFPEQFADMKWLLQTLNDTASFPYNLSLDEEALKYFEAEAKKPGRENDFYTNMSCAEYLLIVGRSEEAVERYQQVLARIRKGEIKASPEEISEVNSMLAISYFRMAEQSNCIVGHNPDACILPFSPKAFHADSFGTVKAINVLLEELKHNPSSAQNKWMLNIVSAAIGRNPLNIPVEYRTTLEKFKSTFNTQSFRNVAESAGLDVERHAGGVAIADYSSNGLLDVVVSSCKTDENLELFLNNGNGTFSNHTDDYGLRGIIGAINVTHMDYNNDGWEDVYMMRGGWYEGYGNYPNSLLRNNGNGTFTDVTYKAGLLSFHPTHSACWGDINNDGFLDVFVGNETSNPNDPHVAELYINNGNETFTEISQQSGVDVKAFIKGVLFFDYNNDGWQDLYLSNYESANVLFKNNGKDKKGNITFTNVTKEAGVALPLSSFPAFACDINNDGWEDLYVGAFSQSNYNVNLIDEYKGTPSPFPSALYINQKNGTFKDMAQQYGLTRTIFAMGLNYGDIDNDGYEDFYAATGNPDFRSLFPNLLFHNLNGKGFEDITVNTHTGHLQKGHGVAFADLDNDLDIYNNVGGFYYSDFFRNAVFENPGFNNHYVGLRLTGVTSNRNASGARIKMTVKEGNITRTLYKTISTGGSFGASPYEQVIGIGKATSISQISITWPGTGIVQTFSNVIANKTYSIVEKAERVEEIIVKTFRFK